MIFLSIPYSDKNKAVIEYRVKSISQYSAKLLKDGISCISPVTSGVTILQHAELPSDFNFWCKLSFDLLILCNEMHVLMVDGWEGSLGVQEEIKFAQEHNIKITYINFKNQ